MVEMRSLMMSLSIKSLVRMPLLAARVVMLEMMIVSVLLLRYR